MVASLTDLVEALDECLDIAAWPDYPGAFNGLQVERLQNQVQRIGYGVDACLATVRSAVQQQVDLLLVHHGMLWTGPHRLVGSYGAMVRLIMHNDLALYSAHLPLDGHAQLGNNIQLAKALGLQNLQSCAPWEGRPIGWMGEWGHTTAELSRRLESVVGRKVWFGADTADRLLPQVAVVSGGAADFWPGLQQQGCAALVTGEGEHHEFVAARDAGMVILEAGHYHTEIAGVKATAEWLAGAFDVVAVACGSSPMSTS